MCSGQLDVHRRIKESKESGNITLRIQNLSVEELDRIILILGFERMHHLGGHESAFEIMESLGELRELKRKEMKDDGD